MTDNLRHLSSLVILFALLCFGCGTESPPADDARSAPDLVTRADTPDDRVVPAAGEYADVVAVEYIGDQLAVTVRSPDTGCDRYADWWEVTHIDGTLIHRRILAHSHVDEQPFTRSGGPIFTRSPLIIRAHMHPDGFGGMAFRGTIDDGFEAAPDIGADFTAHLELGPPLPDGCAF